MGGTLNADMDEMCNEAKMSEEKAARAMIDAARLADELRSEQDMAMSLEKDRKLLEAQCKDPQSRRHGDASKNLRKSERKIKELTFAADEDKKNHERMQALIDQLQGKVKSYKK